MEERVNILKNRVIVAAGLLILLSVGLLVLSSKFPPSPQPGYPGPCFFPNLVLMAIILCCSILIYREVKPEKEPKTIHIDWKNPDVAKTVFTLVITTVYILLLGSVNFFILTFCVLILSMQTLKPGDLPSVLWSGRHFRLIFITSLAVVVGIYFLFFKFLQIPLP